MVTELSETSSFFGFLGVRICSSILDKVLPPKASVLPLKHTVLGRGRLSSLHSQETDV